MYLKNKAKNWRNKSDLTYRITWSEELIITVVLHGLLFAVMTDKLMTQVKVMTARVLYCVAQKLPLDVAAVSWKTAFEEFNNKRSR